jgi:SAM-dependent methyltransferase
MDIRSYNREMWNKQVEHGNPWTIPASPEMIAAARQGEFSVLLTERKPVPRTWFPASFSGLDILGLASGGGQQGPVFAVLGANVTILDNSPRQLEQDREVAAREQLTISTVEGDMSDLSPFADESFNLVFHPVSNCFVPEIRSVWKEAFRVLRRGGALLAGFNNPLIYIFNGHKAWEGVFEVSHKLPFDSRVLSPEEFAYEFSHDAPIEFSHSLEDQIGGQLDAGFLLAGLYEDRGKNPIAEYIPDYIATRAIKP